MAASYTAVRLRSAQRWVSHTRDVQSTLADINNISSRAGRARTRYVDTGDESYLEEYQSAANGIPAKLQQLERLTTDNPEQLDLRKSLEIITYRRLDLLNRSVQLKRSGSSDVLEQGRLRQQIIDVSAETDSLLHLGRICDAHKIAAETLSQGLCGAVRAQAGGGAPA